MTPQVEGLQVAFSVQFHPFPLGGRQRGGAKLITAQQEESENSRPRPGLGDWFGGDSIREKLRSFEW